MSHYHIWWGNGNFDWQSFQIEEEARLEAERLKRANEKYSIVRAEGDCPHCKVKPKV